jgi:hypothetical protein
VNPGEEMAQQLAKKAEVVLFMIIMLTFASKNPNSWDLLLRFIKYVCTCSVNNASISAHSLFSVLSPRRIGEIAEDKCLLPDHKFPEFFNSDDKQYTINSLDAKLDSAVQVLSASSLHHCGLTFI